MKQAINYRSSGKVAFKALGVLLLLSVVVFNPIILHHRFWDIARVLRSVVITSALLAIGMALVALRKWAGVAVSLLAISAAMAVPSGYNAALRLIILTPAMLTLAFWSSLDRPSTRGDALWIVGALSIGVLVEYGAFLSR